MIDWKDVSIHAGIAIAAVIAGSFLVNAFYLVPVISLAFLVREASQHLDRVGIDGSWFKALQPWRWGLGSLIEWVAPTATPLLVAVVRIFV